MLMWDQTLFKNAEVFELDYVPEVFSHRDPQMQGLKLCLKPAVRGGRPVNVLCMGPPATGKTTAVTKTFQELEDYTSQVITVHVNCQANFTRHMVFSRVFSKVLGYDPPSSGVSFKQIFQKTAEHLIEDGKVLVVALDDMNYLFYEGEVDRVLYSLLRAHEEHPGARVGVIGILSDLRVEYQFDPRVSSVFLPEEISFPVYDRSETGDILLNRVRLGFYPRVMSDEVLEDIVDKTLSCGDLRVGIDLLRRSALNAERRASKSISLEDVEGVYNKSRLTHLSQLLGSLTEYEMSVICILADGGGVMQAGDLYECFQKNSDLSYTRFHEVLNKLDGVRLINADYSGKGSRGRSRKLSLRYDVEDVLERMD